MKILKSGGKLHWIKNLYQRYKYCAGCCDIFSLDYYLAKKILPTLKRFREEVGSYPCEFNSIEEWYAILDKMIWSFEFIVNGEDIPEWTVEKDLEYGKRSQEGLELFGKYFRNLWI